MSDKKFNIFEHHHDHGGCDCDDGVDEVLDPAAQSMADALRVSFGLLKIVMVVVVIGYFFSGIYTVKDGHVAVRLRFGHRVGSPVTGALSSGLNFALPYPFEKVLTIPNTPQELRLDSSFWYDMKDYRSADGKDRAHDTLAGLPELDPLHDHSVLTSDMNLMHLKCHVSYQIGGTTDRVDVVMLNQYLKNVKDLSSARRMVGDAVEQAIVHQASRVSASELKGVSMGIQQRILDDAQAILDKNEVGIGIGSVTLTEVVYPIFVNLDFQKSTQVHAEIAQLIEKAREYRNEKLIGVAGVGWEALLDLLDAYDVADAKSDAKGLAVLDAKLDEVFATRKIRNEGGEEFEIQGLVHKMMVEAEADRSLQLQDAHRRLDQFKSLLKEYDASPELYAKMMTESMLRKILGHPRLEKTYLPDARLYIEYSRDSAFRKKLGADKAKADAEAYRE